MDLRPTEEQQQLRDALRRLFDRRVNDLVAALPDPPRHDPARDLADLVAVGLPGLGLPDQIGGAGTFADLALAHQEFGRGLAGPLPIALATAGRLLVNATGDTRDDLLSALAEGRRTATVAIGGEGRIRRRVIGGPEVTDVLIVDGDSTVSVAASHGAGIGWHPEVAGCDIASWTLQVDPAAPHGPQLRLAVGMRELVLSEFSILAAARQVGGARAVVERTIDHVRTREQFDRAIGTFQAVQHQLADVATDLDATELAVAQAAWAVDAALPTAERRRLAAIAALTAAAGFRRATLVAHQLHGGMGFVLDSPLHLWSARAIADPSVPWSGRQVLMELATSSGITADGLVAPPDHRLSLR